MYHNLYFNSSLWEAAYQSDQIRAEKVHAEPCPHCGEKMHWNNYSRQPRGEPSNPEFLKYFGFRMSLCCSRCRKRQTPPSDRFLGRKIYIGAAVVIGSSLCEPQELTVPETNLPVEAPLQAPHLPRPVPAPVKAISPRTLRRWRIWWIGSFFTSGFWRAAQGQFGSSIDMTRPVSSLISKFKQTVSPDILFGAIFRFLAPITTSREYIELLYGK